MKTKTALIGISLILFATAVNAQGTSINLQPTLINTDPVPVQSGEDADLRFKIVNEGDTPAEDVKVQLLDSYPFKVKPDRKTNYSLGEMTQGQEYQISTEVLVADDAPDGSNSFKIEVASRDLSVTHEIPVEVQSEDIELNLANLETTPSTLMPDTEDNKMAVEVVNNGDKKAENVLLELDFPDFFQKTSSFSTRQALGNVGPGETKKAEFKFDLEENAPKGEVEIPYAISYTQGDSTAEIEKESSFNLHLSGRPQFEVVDIKSELKAGSSKPLEVTVKNVGEEKSTSTRIRVLDSADQPFTYDSASGFIGTLEPGEKGKAVFNVDTEQSAVSKDYLVDFEVRGVKDTEVFTEDTTLRLSVERSEERSSNFNVIVLIGLLAALTGVAYYFRERLEKILRN